MSRVIHIALFQSDLFEHHHGQKKKQELLLQLTINLWL